MTGYAAGIDIGGTSTKIGLVSDMGKITGKSSFKTAEFSSIELFAEKTAEILQKLTAPHNIKLQGIGIGAPNGSSITGFIEYAPNLPWKGRVDAAGSLKKAIPDIPVRITNDANAAALGEKLFGAGKDYTDFITVTLGTGVGGGIFCRSRLLEGNSGLAGEIGHTNSVIDGRLCSCGRKGCIEAYCSAGGIRQTALEFIKTTRGSSSLLGKIRPELVDAKKIYEAAAAGDNLAVEVFDYTAKLLASFFADLTHIFSTQAFIVSGGVAQSGDFLFKPLEKYFNEELMEFYRNKNIRILKSSLPEQDSAIIGAASLVLFI